MKTNIIKTINNNQRNGRKTDYVDKIVASPPRNIAKIRHYPLLIHLKDLAEILVISSYPPRECGIATYSQDLIKALNNKFSNSFNIKVCAVESQASDFTYPDEVKWTLDTSQASGFLELVEKINNDINIQSVLIQHEFGLYNKNEKAFLQMLYGLSKPITLVFHTVLPSPD